MQIASMVTPKWKQLGSPSTSQIYSRLNNLHKLARTADGGSTKTNPYKTKGEISKIAKRLNIGKQQQHQQQQQEQL